MILDVKFQENEQLMNAAVEEASQTLAAQFQDAIVINSGGGSDVDLSNYYTKEETDELIAGIEIPEVDLSNYYTKEETNELVQGIDIPEAAPEVYVGETEPTGNELIWINPNGDDATEYATKQYVNEAIAASLEEVENGAY